MDPTKPPDGYVILAWNLQVWTNEMGVHITRCDNKPMGKAFADGVMMRLAEHIPPFDREV